MASYLTNSFHSRRRSRRRVCCETGRLLIRNSNGCISTTRPLDGYVASTVGMPVTRHPPCSPGRAVFPHPVLRLYSRPRCKAQPSGKHSPTWNFRNTRPRYLDAVEDAGKLLPRVAALLAAPPVEPFKRTVHRPMEEAVERASVSAHAIVVVVAS